MKLSQLKYSPEQIGEALNLKRWGGTCYFSICGAGETTLQPELPDIVFNILKQGHFVNITTNGSLTKQLVAILERCRPYIEHLHFAFSFHYIELKKQHLIDVFFDNFQLCKKYGASAIVQFNLCDEYITHLETIKKLCLDKTGALPQVAATRQEGKKLKKINLMTHLSPEKYNELGKQFKSPLFDFTMNNFNVKRREFCYAGDWSATLNLSTGIMKRCYASALFQNIFENPHTPIRFFAVGHYCQAPFCMNSSHFMTLGVIPEIQTPSYAALRDRQNAHWYTSTMKQFLSGKLQESNCQYGPCKKFIADGIGILDGLLFFGYQNIKGFFKKNAIK